MKSGKKHQNTKNATIPRKLTGPVLLVGRWDEVPDLVYETQLRGVIPLAYLRCRQEQYLAVPRWEYLRAAKHSAVTRIYIPEMLGVSAARGHDVATMAAALLKKHGIRRASVPQNFPLGVAEELERQGFQLLCAGESVCPGRETKGMGEVRKMTEAQQAAVIAMRSAIDLISRTEIDEKGALRIQGQRLTSGDVKRRIRNSLQEHDCSCPEVMVAGGACGADPHDPGEGPLRAGEPIVIDIFPRHLEHGYWGDLTRTVVRGRASVPVRRMYAAVRAAQSATLAAIRPGVSCGAIQRSAEREFTIRGYSAGTTTGSKPGFEHAVGHGIGLSLHEEPRMRDRSRRLREGNMIAIEPGLYDPVTGGVRLEDVVLVTRDGWKYLAPCERRLEV
jgi:Xaa-Pro aminopeptidase